MADRDMVNHPSHYETGKFECIDVMLETQGYLATLGFCIGNVFKYSYRHGGKNGKEDIEKLGWYRDKYIELLNRREEFLNNSEDIVKDLSKFFPDADELINGPKSDYKSGTSPDIQAMMDDFSKFMNPPVEEGHSHDDSCGLKPYAKVNEVNPDKDGWYDTEHIECIEGYNPETNEIMVPADKCLETVISNGVSLLWHHGDIIYISHIDSGEFRTFGINGTRYEIIKARLIDIPESCEGGNE